jgi:hypothetical protein
MTAATESRAADAMYPALGAYLDGALVGVANYEAQRLAGR